jgi:hypothetical protein
MKRTVKYTIFLILIFCINNSLFSQADENWTRIDSYDNYDDLEGEWEGTAISVIKGSMFFNTEFKSSLNISLLFKYKKGDKFVSSGVKMDFSNFLADLASTKEIKEKGYTKEILWEMLKGTLKGNFKFDRYSIIVETIESADEYFATDDEGQFYINKNKDALLLIYNKPSFILGIGDTGFTRMIFKKNPN